MTAHAATTQADADEAIVLLKNDGRLIPVAKTAKTIVVIGGHADKGVLSGGGSSQVYPEGGSAVPNEGPEAFPGPMLYYPDSPVEALKARTSAKIVYFDPKDIKAAQKAAKKADLVIVFATQWTAESLDVPDLSLPNGQDKLISSLASKKTVVVLETGGPVLMPWLGKVGAVVEAWYPGSRGGTAIARVLTGEVNPSGHLPVTFPTAEAQLPRPKVEGDVALDKSDMPAARIMEIPTTNYNIEGAAVGYKWFDLKGHKPLFAFGHGLSYGVFTLSDLRVTSEAKSVKVSLKITNTSKVDGKEVAQVYAAPASGGWEAPKRLVGFAKLDIKAGASDSASFSVDPRLLSVYDSASKRWIIKAGVYRFTLAKSAAEPVQTVDITLPDMSFDVNGK